MPQDQPPFAGLDTDLHPPLSAHEANVESDRCYFCYDAPCVTACPTGIDIPLFIRQIQTGNPSGSAKTIFDENILGGMCARVCPTETLCEQACVRNTAETKPVKIGELQRFATDYAQEQRAHPYQRAADSGKSIAVVGAGPAGLACAHRLAVHGHKVTLIDANAKAGGLNEYGIAAYKTVDNFAQREVEFILSIGGITNQQGVKLGVDIQLADLVAQHDAVFLGIGLGDVNQGGLEGESLAGIADAVEFIATLRQASDYSQLAIGRRVVVIGGGMTAIDAAVQAKMLGAEGVTIAYRRGADRMNASEFEQHLAQTKSVNIKHHVQPRRFIDDGNGRVAGVELEYTAKDGSKLVGTGETFVLDADTVFMAIGQALENDWLSQSELTLEHKRIKVNSDQQTSHPDIYAGGDCVSGGEDLTVAAVQDGKSAAEAIHRKLMNSSD